MKRHRWKIAPSSFVMKSCLLTVLCIAAGAAVAHAFFKIPAIPSLAAAASLVSAALLAMDKNAAVHDSFRIPEAAILAASFLAGGAVPFAVRQIIRHKTRMEHCYFFLTELAGALFLLIASLAA